jgi:hypothetical protein
MKTIPLTQGKVTLVDDEDYERFIKWNWIAMLNNSSGRWYAYRNDRILGKRVRIWMHREILGLRPGRIPEVDHKNGDGLDNRRANLRVANRSNNSCNKRARLDNTSGYKDVVFDKRSGKWLVQVQLDSKRVHLGYYRDKLDAVHAADLGC